VAGFLVDNGHTVVMRYGGDLNELREAADNNAQQVCVVS
jgi:hypothetical protein